MTFDQTCLRLMTYSLPVLSTKISSRKLSSGFASYSQVAEGWVPSSPGLDLIAAARRRQTRRRRRRRRRFYDRRPFDDRSHRSCLFKNFASLDEKRRFFKKMVETQKLHFGFVSTISCFSWTRFFLIQKTEVNKVSKKWSEGFQVKQFCSK